MSNKPEWQKIYDARNNAIRAWFATQKPLLTTEAKALGIATYSGDFYRMLKAKTYMRQQKIIGGGFGMPRHAIYVHKGVGRGYPIEVAGGQSITRTKAAQKLTDRGYNKTAIANTLAVSMAGKKNKKRKPKGWFNPIIDRNLPVLANVVASHDADIIATNIFID